MSNNIKRILFIGDIVGRPGRQILKSSFEDLKKQYEIDITIANVENAAGGFGCTIPVYNELLELGIDLFTSGNHIYDQKDMVDKFDSCDKLIRPYNYPPGNPGKGYRVIRRPEYSLAVVNLLGQVFTSQVDCPFRAGMALVEDLTRQGYVNIFVDFHAETTSEKNALGLYLDGKVTAIVGTHTHVVTADERLLPEGSAYITDVGITGFRDGVIGFEKESIISKFLTQRNKRFIIPKNGVKVLQAVVVTFDSSNGKAIGIERIEKIM